MADRGKPQAKQEKPVLRIGLFTAWAASTGLLLLLVVLIARWSLQQIEGRALSRARDDATHRIETIRNRVLEEVAARPGTTLDEVVRSAGWINTVLTRQASTGANIEWIALFSPAGAVLAHSRGDSFKEASPSAPEAPFSASAPAAASGNLVSGGNSVQYSVPIVLKGQQLGTVRIGLSAQGLDETIAELLGPVRHAFILLGCVCFIVLVLGGSVMRQVVRRERMLDHAAAQQERSAAMGALARRMVHEIRNPLNAMRMQIAVVQDMLSDPEISADCIRTEHLGRLDQEVIRIERLAKSFLAFGRPPSDRPELIKLVDLVQDVADFIRPGFDRIGASVIVESDRAAEEVSIRMDRSKLREVLLNLTENSREAMTGGRLTIRLAMASNREVLIQVADTGRGIPESDLPRVFEGLRSTKPDGNGLGLLIVKRIVEDAGGAMRVESRVNQGSCFDVILPITWEGAGPLCPEVSRQNQRTHA